MSALISEASTLLENAETIKSDLPSPHKPTEDERDEEPKKAGEPLGETIDFMGLTIERYQYPEWPEGSQLSEDYFRRRRRRRRRPASVTASGMGAAAGNAARAAAGVGGGNRAQAAAPTVHVTVHAHPDGQGYMVQKHEQPARSQSQTPQNINPKYSQHHYHPDGSPRSAPAHVEAWAKTRTPIIHGLAAKVAHGVKAAAGAVTNHLVPGVIAAWSHTANGLHHVTTSMGHTAYKAGVGAGHAVGHVAGAIAAHFRDNAPLMRAGIGHTVDAVQHHIGNVGQHLSDTVDHAGSVMNRASDHVGAAIGHAADAARNAVGGVGGSISRTARQLGQAHFDNARWQATRQLFRQHEDGTTDHSGHEAPSPNPPHGPTDYEMPPQHDLSDIAAQMKHHMAGGAASDSFLTATAGSHETPQTAKPAMPTTPSTPWRKGMQAPPPVGEAVIQFPGRKSFSQYKGPMDSEGHYAAASYHRTLAKDATEQPHADWHTHAGSLHQLAGLHRQDQEGHEYHAHHSYAADDKSNGDYHTGEASWHDAQAGKFETKIAAHYEGELPPGLNERFDIDAYLKKLDEQADKFTNLCKEAHDLSGVWIELQESLHAAGMCHDLKGNAMWRDHVIDTPFDGKATLMKDKLPKSKGGTKEEFVEKLKSIAERYNVDSIKLFRIIEAYTKFDLDTLNELSEGMTQGWARGDLRNPVDVDAGGSVSPSNAGEPPLEWGQDSSIVLIDPPVEQPELEGGIQPRKGTYRDNRLDDPRYNHRHAIRRRAAGLGIIHSDDRAAMDTTLPLTDRQWGSLGTGEPDASTADEMMLFLLQQKAKADADMAYSKIFAASGISIDQAIEALKKYRKQGVQNKNSDAEVISPSGGPGDNEQPVYSGAD